MRKGKNREPRIPFLKNTLFAVKLMWSVNKPIFFTQILSRAFMRAVFIFYSTYTVAEIFNDMEKGTADPAYALGMLGLVTLLMAGCYVFYCWSQKILERKFRDDVNRKLDDLIHEKAVSVDLECFENPEFYSRYVKANGDGVTSFLSLFNGFVDFTSNIPMLIVALSFIITREPLILSLTVLSVFTSLYFGNRDSIMQDKKWNEQSEISRKNDYILRTARLADFAKDIRLSDMDNLLLKRHGEVTEECIELEKKYAPALAGNSFLTYGLAELTGSALPIFYVAIRAIGFDGFSIGTALALINAVKRVSGVLLYESRMVNEINRNIRKISAVRDFFNYKNKIVPIAENPITAEVNPEGNEIIFDRVCFTYPGANTPALVNVSFEIKKKSRVALVGYNGAGKTTLVKLLMRLYDPDSGRILLDGHDLREYDPESLRKVFATVFQDFKLFGLTLGENVLLRPLETEDDRKLAEKCLSLSGFGEKLADLPAGLDTVVTREFVNAGTEFSGGEGQKIAIARVFSRSASTVILDEPTSALDPIAEGLMYDNMEKACKGKTVVFISHRLSSAKTSDLVILLDGGEVKEIGNHESLMKQGGIYADMFNKQSERYAKDKEKANGEE